MGNNDHREGGFLPQAQEIGRQPLATLHIETGEGLVQQEQFRSRGQGPGKGDAARFPARQAGRAAALKAAKVHEIECMGDRQLITAVWPGEGDVLLHSQMRE